MRKLRSQKSAVSISIKSPIGFWIEGEKIKTKTDTFVLIDFFLFPPSQAANSCLLANFGIRTGFTEEQLNIMNNFFQNISKYPDKNQKSMLSEQLGITISQVSIWFNNKRNKRK